MKHTVPDQYLVHIGDIVVSFALLEMTVQGLTGSLIAENQRVGQIITAELSFKNLRALTISLYIERHGEDDDYSKLKPLMNKAGKIEETRNNIIHSIWAANKDHIIRIKTTAKEKKGLNFHFENISTTDLLEFSRAIRGCAQEIQNFQLELIQKNKAINNPIQKIW